MRISRYVAFEFHFRYLHRVLLDVFFYFTLIVIFSFIKPTRLVKKKEREQKKNI